MLHGRTNPEKLTHFIESTAEARCRQEVPKSTHGVIALLDATMILFQVIVEILIPSMENVCAKYLADRTRVRTVPIRGHSLWRRADDLKGSVAKNYKLIKMMDT
ncbi:hypothetical protein KSF_103720 [Reticulibacter mediterranei]|uniref:Uncharacterized protein n=1 Tax=Reticulibacter mediterranei TaxID=2778369 RepID=A0A8J3IYK9_9CHLR|nr:hypothetical protein KSF_103720 [Reticulibacter mediterranei]